MATPGMREAIEHIRDAGYGLLMTNDRIFFDGRNIRESLAIERGSAPECTDFDELRVLVVEIFQQPRR